MKKIVKTITSLTLATVVSMSLVSCGGGKQEAANSDTTVSYWTPISPNAAQTVGNLSETPFAQKLMEDVGCTIEYQHPVQGQENEKFNILIAGGNLPDIIEYDWTNYLTDALSNNLIQEIDLEKDAPNLAAYVKEHPEIDRMIKTDDGKYYGYPFIRGDEYLLTSAGPILRKDWLDELGLEVPETIDEWTEVLTAFKENKSSGAPLCIDLNSINFAGMFVGAYGIYDGLYVEGDKIVYGPMEDAYKDFLTQMNEWYTNGLLDADFASMDTSTMQSNILNGVSGATYGSCGGGIGKWLAAATEEGYDLVGAKYPVLNKGDKPQFGAYQFPVTGRFAVITKDAKNKELCTKLLDYGYSDSGHMLFNFGIENESYTMVNGYPTYTEEITNNKDGLSMSVSLARYALSEYMGPFVQDKRYMEQYANLPQQKEALTNWMYTDMSNHAVPNITLSQEAQNELSTIRENIDTYKTEMQAKFIMGVVPLSDFDQFREELKTRGIDKLIQYTQEAYDRYMAR